jgi:NDP-sugar pyrophosphorylase family protein
MQNSMSNNNQSSTQLIGYVFSSGLGTRLMPYTEDIPKPLLLKHQGKNFLEINIERLLKIGASKVFVNYSYGEKYFTQAIQKYGEQVSLIYEAKPIGQGKAICNILPSIQDKNFLYTVNGDTIAEYDNLDFLNYAVNNKIDYLISSDRHTSIAANLIVDHEQKLIGCKLNEKQYLYTNANEELLFLNNLGDYVFKIDSLLDIYEEASIQDFIGIFGENDLAEIMIKNQKNVVVKDINVKSYYSVNTIEEYNNFIKNNHAS